MASQVARANVGQVTASHHALRRAHCITPRRQLSTVSLPRPGHGAATRTERTVVRAQTKEEVDFDKLLIILATKWEETDKKGLVVGYSAAAVFTLFFMEWLIHLPVLDVLLGFPIQLVGLATCPLLIVRWFVVGKDWFEDVSAASGEVVDALPGLKKTE